MFHSIPQQEKHLEANLNKHRIWLKTRPEEPLTVTAHLHLLLLPDRKRQKKNSPQLFPLEIGTLKKKKKKEKKKMRKLNGRKLYRTKKVKHLQAVQGPVEQCQVAVPATVLTRDGLWCPVFIDLLILQTQSQLLLRICH